MGVGHGDRNIYISYVFRRPPTATFASAMRWREDTVDGSNVSTTAAVRWSGRHEALSSHIGVFAVLVVVSASFSS